MKQEDLKQKFINVNDDYERTMNKIIFDKHLNDKSSDLIPHNLTLRPKTKKVNTPTHGLI